MIETQTSADGAAQESPLQVEVHRAQRINKEAQNQLDRMASLVDRVIGAEPTAPTLIEKTAPIHSVGGKVGEIQEAQTDTLSTQRSVAELLIKLEQNL